MSVEESKKKLWLLEIITAIPAYILCNMERDHPSVFAELVHFYSTPIENDDSKRTYYMYFFSANDLSIQMCQILNVNLADAKMRCLESGSEISEHLKKIKDIRDGLNSMVSETYYNYESMVNTSQND